MEGDLILEGGMTDGNKHNAKSFCRGLALRLEQLRPAAFDEFTVRQVVELGPDHNERVSPLDGLLVREARNLFAFSPLMLG